MTKFKVVTTFLDGEVVESPPIPLNPGEDIYDIAAEMSERASLNPRPFVHIDSEEANVQLLIPLKRIRYIRIVGIEETQAAGRSSGSGAAILRVVE